MPSATDPTARAAENDPKPPLKEPIPCAMVANPSALEDKPVDTAATPCAIAPSPDAIAQGVRVVTNAGGVNPESCKARMEEIAAQAGVSFKIAIVSGDDLIDRVPDLASAGTTVDLLGDVFDPELVKARHAAIRDQVRAMCLARS